MCDVHGARLDEEHRRHWPRFKQVWAPLVKFAEDHDVRIDPDRLDEVGIMANPLQYHTPKIPGLGDVDWGLFVRTLARTGYSGPVCIEVEDREFEVSLEWRKEAIRRSALHLRQFMSLENR